MKNANKPAYPVRGAGNTPFTNGDDFEEYAKQCDPTIGLTKREIFAMAAMQGILANHGLPEGWKPEHLAIKVNDAVQASVIIADELLKQLNHE